MKESGLHDDDFHVVEVDISVLLEIIEDSEIETDVGVVVVVGP